VIGNIEGGEKVSKQFKRKKSVHFPDNPVIPIDDSSFEGSTGDIFGRRNSCSNKKVTDKLSKDGDEAWKSER